MMHYFSHFSKVSISSLCKAEVAALWHPPHKAFQGSHIVWRKHQPPVPYPIVTNKDGIKLGYGYYQEKLVPVYLHEIDRDTHTEIVGRTGTGKSTTMLNLILQDIQAGESVFVLDPHGQLIRSILQSGIPPKRENDLVLLDLADEQYPIPLNLFAGNQSYAAIGRIINIMEKFFTSTGVQIDKFLRAGIKALQEQPNTTMVDFFLLFTNEAYRSNILQGILDIETYQTLYADYHILGPAKQASIRGPLLNRISPFISNPYLYPSLCHPQRLDFEAFAQSRKIVLASLAVDSEKVPDNEQGLVGALMISMLQMMSMRPNREVTRFYGYIDEVQKFMTTSLNEVFEGARKFGLSLTVAHQHFDQLEDQMLHSILGNAGTLIVFNTYARNAQQLIYDLQPAFTVTDVVNLNRFKAAAKIYLKGEVQPPFMLVGEKPVKL